MSLLHYLQLAATHSTALGSAEKQLEKQEEEKTILP